MTKNRIKKNWMLNAFQYQDGSKKVFRMRSIPPQNVSEKTLSTCVIIDWPYSGELPTKETLNAIRVFEEALSPLDTESGDSVLFHIITGCGNREWCYYTKNYDYFIHQLSSLLEDFPRFPISIEYQENTNWNYWKAMLDFANEEEVAVA